MIAKFLRNMGLAGILMGYAKAQESPSKPEVYQVNAPGRVYSYTDKKLADLAQKAIEVALDIQEKHGAKPYVWGGEGFESLEQQKKLYGRSVTDKQPSGSWRAGQPTVPGVDCSGLIFQLRRAMQLSYSRLTADGYARKTKTIFEETKDVAPILEKALPGDLIFFMEKGKAVHTSWYLGNGLILESVGTRADVSNIPKEALERWHQYAKPQQHKKTDHDYGGIQVRDLKKEKPKYGLRVGRFEEFLADDEKEKKNPKGKKDALPPERKRLILKRK